MALAPGASLRLSQRVAGALRNVAPAAASLAKVAVLLGGAGLTAFGAWQAYAPAGPIVAGVLLMVGVIGGVRGNAG